MGTILAVFPTIIKVGAVLGLSSTMVVMTLGQPRVFYSMSKDGLLPPMFSKVHPKFGTPYLSQYLIGGCVALIGGLFPISLLGEMVSIGTLFAFILVCAAVMYLRRSEAEAHRPFRAPGVPVTPILGVLFCLALMAGLPLDTWIRLFVWMAIGLAIYFAYSRHHSVVQRRADPAAGLTR